MDKFFLSISLHECATYVKCFVHYYYTLKHKKKNNIKQMPRARHSYIFNTYFFLHYHLSLFCM